MPGSTKPSFPIPWIASYFITAIIVIAGVFAIAWFLQGASTEYDFDDPDFRTLEAIVQSANPRRGDFSPLNGGDWRALCLIGPGSDLAGALRAAAIEAALASKIRQVYETEPLELEPSEFVLLYVTGGGAVKRLRHPHGFAFARTGAAACLTRETPVLPLPVGL